MTAVMRQAVSESGLAREEILAILDRTERVDLGTICSLIREVMGPGREPLVARIVQSLTGEGEIQVETVGLGGNPRGPLVAYLRRAPHEARAPLFRELPALAMTH